MYVPNLTVAFSVDVLGFFHSTLLPEGRLSLDELHLIVQDIWFPRASNKNMRNDGRPTKFYQGGTDRRIEDSGSRGIQDGFQFVSRLDEPKWIVTHLFFVSHSRSA